MLAKCAEIPVDADITTWCQKLRENAVTTKFSMGMLRVYGRAARNVNILEKWLADLDLPITQMIQQLTTLRDPQTPATTSFAEMWTRWNSWKVHYSNRGDIRHHCR